MILEPYRTELTKKALWMMEAHHYSEVSKIPVETIELIILYSLPNFFRLISSRKTQRKYLNTIMNTAEYIYNKRHCNDRNNDPSISYGDYNFTEDL